MTSNQSLDRGLDVIELLERSDADLGVRDIARRLTLSPAIVQRLINALVARGYAQQNAETKRYRLGHRAIALGSGREPDDLASLGRAELRRLAEEHRLNGFLAAPQGERLVYVLAVQSSGPITIRVSAGSTLPWHSTAIGKALLAEMAPAAARRLLGRGPLPARTDRTITSVDQLLDSLDSVRAKGFAVSNEENLPGVLAVGAVVRKADGGIAGGLSVAFARGLDASHSIKSVAPLVVEAAARLSRGLGYVPDVTNVLRRAAT